MALALIGMAVGIGVPVLANFMDSYRLDTSTSRLVGDIRYARAQAAMLGTEVRMCRYNIERFPCDGTKPCRCGRGTRGNQFQSGWLVFSNPDGSPSFDPTKGDKLLRTGPPSPDGVAIFSSRGTKEFAFNPVGRLQVRKQGKMAQTVCYGKSDRRRIRFHDVDPECKLLVTTEVGNTVMSDVTNPNPNKHLRRQKRKR